MGRECEKEFLFCFWNQRSKLNLLLIFVQRIQTRAYSDLNAVDLSIYHSWIFLYFQNYSSLVHAIKLLFRHYQSIGHLQNQPREVLWTHVETIYSMMWLTKPKKYNNQYYADNHTGEHSKGQYYWMRNKEQYFRTLSKGDRLWNGLFADVHYTVQIHPCWGLLED